MSRNQRKSAWGIPPTPEGCIGPSRRNPYIGRKEHISQQRLLLRDDVSLEPLPVTEQQPLDSLTQGFDCIMARIDKLESRWEEINCRRQNVIYQQWQQEQYTPHRTWQHDHSSWHEQPPGWPPPPRQRSPPTCWPTQQRRHAYWKQQQTHAYRQQQQPVAAHMEPLNCRIGDSRPVFEQSSYACKVSDEALQNSDAEYHVGQSDYPPPHSPYRDS